MNDPAVNTSLMQRMNRLKVLRYIKDNPGSARCTISEKTGLSLGAVTNLTKYLVKERLILESGYISEDRVGRKRVKLKFNGGKYRIVCVLIKRSTAIIYLTDLAGKTIQEIRTDISGKNIESITEEISGIISGFREKKIIAVGISLSALVLDKGESVISSSLQFSKTNIREMMEEKTGCPVFVENMSISKALGYIKNHIELKSEKVVFADVDEGFGAVYINNGEVIRDIPCEIGHTTLAPDGPQCFCGNRGCLEIMLSSETDANKRSEYMGIGLASLVNLFAPTVLITNGIANVSKEDVLKNLEERAYPVLCDRLENVFSDTDDKMILDGIADSLWDFIFNIDFENPLV